MATAGQVMLSMPGRGVRPRVTLNPACGKRRVEDPARARLRVIQAAWAVFQAMKRVGCAGGERGGEDVNAGAALAGVQAEADSGVGVVGDFRAVVEINGRIGLARGDDLDAASGEQGAEADAEGEVDGFFELAAVEVGAGVVTAMGGVEDDNEARCGRGRSWEWCAAVARRRETRESTAVTSLIAIRQSHPGLESRPGAPRACATYSSA